MRSLGVSRLALFGSVLRNEARADSDVDLLVQFAAGRKSFDGFMKLGDLLEARLGHRVELVTVESLSPFIGPRILAEALDVLRDVGLHTSRGLSPSAGSTRSAAAAGSR